MRSFLLAFFIGFRFWVHTATAAPVPTPPPASAPDAWFESAAAFAALEPPQREIDLLNLDAGLLGAAIFHETNARRTALGLPALRHDLLLSQVAARHTLAMAAHKELTHGTPGGGPKTSAMDRIKAGGLNPRLAAENIALAYVLQYEAGRSFYVRQENERSVLSTTPNGPALRAHSYLSFAKTLLDQWMSSPGHRANILRPEAQFVGIGTAPAKDARDFDVLYCEQEFFAPMPDPA